MGLSDLGFSQKFKSLREQACVGEGERGLPCMQIIEEKQGIMRHPGKILHPGVGEAGGKVRGLLPASPQRATQEGCGRTPGRLAKEALMPSEAGGSAEAWDQAAAVTSVDLWPVTSRLFHRALSLQGS